jgi:hypothetical protein
MLAWSAPSTQLLLDALREAGPDRGCRTWWGPSESPQTSGAVARHQLQEVTVHTYDAAITLGVPPPLPDEAALDGVEEFLSTCCASTAPGPHEPAAVDFHAAEGCQLADFAEENRAWLRVYRLPAYSPDLNPVEGIWSLLKRSMANFAAADVDGLVRIIKRKLKKIQYRPHLIDGCLTATGLTIEPW